MTRLARLALVVALMIPGLAHAAPPAERAQALHEQAVDAGRAGHWDTAVARWREAEALDPHWKYSFNLASTHAHRKQWLDAWAAARRTRAAGLPEQHLPTLTRIEDEVRAALLESHAWVELSVVPADAVVERDGVVWTAREGWVAASESRLTIRRDGYLVHQQVWKHPIGERSASTVTLSAEPVAALPVDPEPARPAPDPAPVVGVGATDTATAGPAWAWGLLGAGAAVAAGGAGLLGWSGAVATEADGLRNEALSFPEYDRRYEELSARHSDLQISGAVLIGVGAAAAITGLVLALTDEGLPGPTVTLSPAWLGDGGMTAHVRF